MPRVLFSRRDMTAAKPLMWIWVTLAASGTVLAQSRAPAELSCAAELMRVPDSDPLELARVAGRCGDRGVLLLLSDSTPGAMRLAAIGASRWLIAPESALPALIRLLGGRDSLLAPAAARATLEIALRLDRDALDCREAAPEQLAASLTALRQVSEMPHVRPELRMMAGRAAALLEAAGVPTA